MTTVVTVMDRAGFEANTDTIVVVEPARFRLRWVPRDVWCDRLDHRINAAFRRGGHAELLACLRSLGIDVDHSVCLPRGLVERVLQPVTVTVPVSAPLHFWYPLSPTAPIQEGRKAVDFLPPAEVLSGERIHQWLGARYGRDERMWSSDLGRIERQQRFVRAALRQGIDLSGALDDPEAPSFSDRSGALRDLRRVRWWWRMVWTDQVVDRVLDDGRQVLELRSPEPRPPAWRRRWRRRIDAARARLQAR